MDYQPKTLADKMTLVRMRTVNQRRAVQDKGARDYLASQLNTDAGAYNVSKKLFTKSERYARVKTALYELSKYVKQHTSPWLDDGFRALPNQKYLEFTQGVAPLKLNLEQAAADFANHYASEVQADIAHLKGRGNYADYDVTAPDIGAEITFVPVPDAGDFRVEVTEADRQRLNDALAEAERSMRADLLNRMMTPLRHMSERLVEYKGDKGQRWHQSSVEELYASLSTLESLNVNDDAEVSASIIAVRGVLKQFAGNEVLKNSQLARDNAKQQIDDILSKFS